MRIRSERIGFDPYLHRRYVTGVDIPRCQCGYPSQNISHMIMAYSNWAKRRVEILGKADSRSFEAMMNSPKDVARISRWIQTERRLEQFGLTLEVEATMKARKED